MNVTPRQLDVLGAIIRLRRERRPCTYRTIMETSGIKHLHQVEMMLQKLRRKGLVTWEPKRSGTIRALVRFIPASRLGDE